MKYFQMLVEFQSILLIDIIRSLSFPFTRRLNHKSLPVLPGVPNLHRKLTRSASVTPPISVPTSVSDWLNSQDDMAVLRNNNSQHYHSNVVIEGHAPLSPQSSVTSSGSGSDTHEADQHQRNTFLEECSGMKGTVTSVRALPSQILKLSEVFEVNTLAYPPSQPYQRPQDLDNIFLNKLRLCRVTQD